MIRYVAIHGGIVEKFWERWEQLSERAQIHTEVQRPKHGIGDVLLDMWSAAGGSNPAGMSAAPKYSAAGSRDSVAVV